VTKKEWSLFFTLAGRRRRWDHHCEWSLRGWKLSCEEWTAILRGAAASIRQERSQTAIIANPKLLNSLHQLQLQRSKISLC